VTTILVSAGDASGEAHAADLVRDLRERHPSLRFVGMGGPRMAAEGVEIVLDQRELAVGGVLEIIASAARLIRGWRRMLDCVRRERPDLIVLVDSGGFHLPLARRIRRLVRSPILYYVAPQIWAWRPRRLQKLAARADRIAVILPFEREYYAARGLVVDYVGHPALDRAPCPALPPEGSDAVGGVAVSPVADRERRRQSARRRLGLSADGPVMAILPGSRRNELARHLPVQLDAFARLRRERPGLTGIIALAASLERAEVETRLAHARQGADSGIRLVEGQAESVIDAADVAIAKPGTITVELMLRETPMVVVGRAHPLTAWIARGRIEVDRLSMPNLIAEEDIVPELLQEEARPDRIAAAAAPLFEGPERLRQLEGLARASRLLGEPGAARRTSAIVEEMLEDLGA